MKELRMVKHKNSAQIYRSRLMAAFLAVILMLGCVLVPDTEAKASSLALGVSASSVKIGDTVTVSITVPAGVSATVNVTYPTSVFSFSSASDTANANGGTVSMTIGGYGSTNTKTTGTMKFKAKAAGSATFSASAPIAGNQEGDRVTVGGASATVRVKNESNEDDGGGSESGNNNSTDSENGNSTRKSADNSLSTLTLSSGTLSPSFQYNVTNYTAEVANSVTSVVVSAKASNAKATVESVKGGENLVVGANKIQIVVKAENGVTATYTITVTRKEAGAEENTDTPDEELPGDTDTPQEQCYVVNGRKLYPNSEGDETLIPEGFELSEITLWGTAYPYWVNEKIGSNIGLIYLVDENQENGAWYRISSTTSYEASTFVCLHSEYGYVIAVPEMMNESAPDGYAAETISIEGKGIADAYFAQGDEEVCLIYAVNQDGVFGLYRYDVKERTYMRYTGETVAEETQVEEEVAPQPDNSRVEELESQNRLLFYAFIVMIAILLLVIVLLIVKRKHGGNDEFDDYEDYEDYDVDADDDNADADNVDDDNVNTDIDEATDARDAVEPNCDEKSFIQEPEKEVDKKPEKQVEELDLEAMLVQAVSETLQENAASEDDLEEPFMEEPKKKLKKKGRFGKKKESEQEDDDLEFLDL